MTLKRLAIFQFASPEKVLKWEGDSNLFDMHVPIDFEPTIKHWLATNDPKTGDKLILGAWHYAEVIA